MSTQGNEEQRAEIIESIPDEIIRQPYISGSFDDTCYEPRLVYAHLIALAMEEHAASQ